MGLAGHVARVGEGEAHTWFLVGKTEGKSLLGCRRHRWKGNIKMDLQVVGWGGMDWIYLSLDGNRWWELVKAVMNLRIP